MQIGEILALNLKELRSKRGWKQPNLAEATGLALETIKRLETNAAGFSRESISALAAALDVPESRLFQDPNSIPAPTPKEAYEIIGEALGLTGQQGAMKRRLKTVPPSPGPIVSAVKRELIDLIASSAVNDDKADILLGHIRRDLSEAASAPDTSEDEK